MKKLLIIILFVLPLTVFSQSKFKGFFKPVPEDLLSGNVIYKIRSELTPPNAWIFRPAVSISAMQIMKSKEVGKQVDVTSFTKAGMGISYAHFVNSNGVPYNDISVNALFLFDVMPAGSTAINLSPVIAVAALNFVSVGVGYDIGAKNVFGLIGINYNFSK
jgi:hypothetical protein